MPTVWTSLEIAKLLVSILTPLTVLLLGAWFNRRLKTFDIVRQQEAEERQQRAEEYKREVERTYTPHLELGLSSEFLGSVQDNLLTHFTLTVTNRGRVMHRFKSIRLRVRGIARGEPLSEWPAREPRALFPVKVFEAELVPPHWNFIFIEPGVAHPIGLTTIVPNRLAFILVHAECAIDQFTPLTVEAVFAVPNSAA